MAAVETALSGIAERFIANVQVCSPAVAKLAVGYSSYNGIDSLEKLVGGDPEFSLRVLAMANSAFYSQREQVDTLRSALVILGDRMVQRLAAGFLARSLDCGSDPQSLALWRHSVAVAVAARLIATVHRELVPERAHLVGLLHNIGRLAILRCEPELYNELISLPHDQRADRERALIGRTQAELGADIAILIGLPGKLADAIRFCEHDVLGDSNDPLSVTICIAHHLCARTDHTVGGPAEIMACVDNCVASLGLIGEDLETLALGLDEKIETELALLSVGG